MDVAKAVGQLVDELSDQFVNLSDKLWDEPQLRWQEHLSVEAQKEVATAHGLRVTSDVAGLPTAFSAEGGVDGPVIAFLGEYDSLAGMSQESGTAVPHPDAENSSGNGQGCGHHLLGSASLLAAVVTEKFLRERKLPGTVRYYGCPAEEAAAGKTFMVREGAFDGVDAAVSWHPASTTGVMRMNSLAYCQVYFSFRGIAAHAGVSPHLGRSALDAVELMNIGANFLREHMPSNDRVHYAITDAGGLSPNVVQASATVYYIVRSPTVAGMRDLYERVVKIAQGAALMTETDLTIEFDGACSELLPNNALENSMQRQFQALGGVPFDEADFARALPFLGTLAPSEVAGSRRAAGVTEEFPLHTGVESFEPNGLRFQMGGSTDVGDVSWIVPTIQCGVAVAAIGTGMHSWQLVAQGKLPAAHKGMLHAAKIMACTAIDMIVNKNVLDDATVEFQTQTAKTPYDHPIPAGIVAPPLREALKV